MVTVGWLPGQRLEIVRFCAALARHLGLLREVIVVRGVAQRLVHARMICDIKARHLNCSLQVSVAEYMNVGSGLRFDGMRNVDFLDG